MLEDSARTVPERDAVVCGSTRMTYREVDSAANKVANLLVGRGIGPGDKVALTCPNVPYFPIAYYGILKTGAVVVPLNVLFKAREVAYHLTDSDALAYLCFEGTPDLAIGREGRAGFDQAEGCEHFVLIPADPEHPPSYASDDGILTRAVEAMSTAFDTRPTAADDTAVILYTSGTTGRPKGAELTHANLGFNVLTNHRLFQSSPLNPDVHLVALPLFHSFGQTVHMNCGFGAAATLVLMPRFDAATALALLVEERVTFFAGVPTMYWSLLGALSEDVDVATIARSLRRAVAGGASLPVEILRQVSDRFHVQILEGYGLSETSPVATFSQLGAPTRPGSIGTPVWGVEAELIDSDWNRVEGPDAIGEIAIRGHNVMKGYCKRPDDTAAAMRDGWLRTGDLARRDADGYYYIVDRAKDMIIRGGFNVYPREVEEILMTHPDVSLAAVVGVPDDEHGEEIKAFVIRGEGSTLSAEELVEWSRREMAGFKYPRIVEFRDALPMTATGKILKRELT
jgi:long-chain acyl-CoA synthetase